MSLRDALVAAAAPLARLRSWAAALPWLLSGAVALALAAWLSRWGVGARAAWAAVAWLLLLVAAVVAAWRAREARYRFGARQIAERLEREGQWRRGALSTLLAPVAPGTSAVLHGHAAAAASHHVQQAGGAALASDVAAHRRRVWRLVGGLVGAVGCLVLARPAAGRSGVLMSPWDAWRALVAPVRLSTGTPVVERGASAVLELTALGQRQATLLSRSPGEEWHREVVDLDPDGRATVTTPPLTGDLVARLESAGRRSADLTVTVRLPAFLGTLVLRAGYPAYLGLADEDLPIGGDTLIVPMGTRLSVRGDATAPLEQAWFLDGRDSIPLTVDGAGLSGVLTPSRDAAWQLYVVTAQGGELAGVPGPIPVRVVADSAPAVTVPVPGTDTIAPPSHRLPVVVAIEDDHGLATAVIELRRDSVLLRQPLDLTGATDRALISTTLDLDALGAGPGDTVHYVATARDNAPRAGVGRSREFRVVIPTAAEDRANQAAATAQATSALDTLVDAARRAQRAAEDLARERQRAGSTTGQGEAMSADASRRVEQAAAAQEEVARQVEQMRERLTELEQTAARGAEPDSSLMGDLREIRDMLDRAMTPELREAMQQLRASLQNLDAEATRDALSTLAERQQKMREALERARELFDRAARETALAQLASEADDLADAQQRAIQTLAVDSVAGARAETATASRADSLAAQLDAAAEAAPSQVPAAGLNVAADAAREAAKAMRAAASAAQRGERQEAARQATAAGEALQPLGDEIRQQREQMQQAMREDVLTDLRRLLTETSRVLSRQYAVAEAFKQGATVGPLRGEEAMLEEATSKLLQQVITVAGKNALISPRISVALAGARDGLRAVLEAASAASPSLGLAADRAGEAVDMLSLAAYSLLQSARNIEQSQSGSGMEEAMQQMMQMAGQQNAAAQQGQAMQQQGSQVGMGELMQLALQQRAIAQQLERMRAQGQLPGTGELAREAQDVARQIEAGRLNAETVERQKTLFRRMLDAGRSLEGEQDEQSTERQSESATARDPARPGATDPRLLRGARYQVPEWDELQRLAPDERRRVLDYFRLLTEVGGP